MDLVAKTPTEKRLKKYLDDNASAALREKIAELPDRFNLDAAWRFVQEEARKELKSRSGFLEDEVVFGWLVHYYEDVAPAEAAKPAPATGVNGNKKPKSRKVARAKAKGASPARKEDAAQGEKPAPPVPDTPPASDTPAKAPEAEDSGFSFALFDSEVRAK